MEEPKPSKFLMTIQGPEVPMEDPTPCPKIPGAHFTTGKGGDKGAEEGVEMGAPNGDSVKTGGEMRCL